MEYYPLIDLHCHILPRLDDGPSSDDEALEMARIAVQDGITDIVATPHTENGLYQNSPERITEAAERLQRKLREENLPLRIHVGSEVRIHIDLIDNLQSSRTATFCNAKRYVLLELPSSQVPLFMTDMIRELKAASIMPILAHPERNKILQAEPERLREWIEAGAIAQVTADSLAGRMGKRVQTTARRMVVNNLVHVLASDAHNSRNRKPQLREAFRLLERMTSRATARQFLLNAQSILAGNDCKRQDSAG